MLLKTHSFFSCFFSVFFILGLHDINAQHVSKINYETLPLIKLELKSEVGNGSGNNGAYIAGQLENLIVFPNGYILISDRRKNTLELFDPGGAYLKQVAKEGNGPGELPPYFMLDEVGFDQIAIRDGQSNEIDLFSLTNQLHLNYMTSYTPSLKNDSRLEIIGALSQSCFFAFTTDWKKEIALNTPEYEETIIKVINDSFEVEEDSIQVLKKANSLFGDPAKLSPRVTFGGLAILGRPPYRFEDHFISLGSDGYLIAKADESTIFRYTNQHQLHVKIKLVIKERKVTKSDLDNAFKTHEMARQNHNIRLALERYVKSEKPPFLKVWASGKRILLHTDYSSDGFEYVLLNAVNGNPLGKFYLSEFEEIQQIKTVNFMF